MQIVIDFLFLSLILGHINNILFNLVQANFVIPHGNTNNRFFECIFCEFGVCFSTFLSFFFQFSSLPHLSLGILSFLRILVLRILLIVSIIEGLLLVFRTRRVLFLINLLKLGIYVLALTTSSVVDLLFFFCFEFFVLCFDLLKHQMNLLVYSLKCCFVELSYSDQPN